MQQQQQNDYSGCLNSFLKQNYKVLAKLGSGAYGVVYKAQHKQTNKIVAIKKSKLEEQQDEGIPSTTIREVAILKKIRHPHIVSLLDISYSPEDKKLYLIFEFINSDLKKYIQKKGKLEENEIRRIMYQLFLGIQALHSKRIIHRDLKPENILIDGNQNVKIADLGLARFFNVPLGKFTKDVATLYYRAPELMMGDECYSVTFDIWAVGCIFAELYIGKPLFFRGMLARYAIQVLGTPSENSYYGISKLPQFRPNFPKFNSKKIGLEALIPQITNIHAMDLLKACLNMDPNRRPTAAEALMHPFFDEIHQNQIQDIE